MPGKQALIPFCSAAKTRLKTLLEKFPNYLENQEGAQSLSYTTQKLQRRLRRHFENSIVIHTQRGKSHSNVILSSKVTLADAIKAIAQLKESFKNK